MQLFVHSRSCCCNHSTWQSTRSFVIAPIQMSTCKLPPEVNFKWMEILEQLIACLMSVRQVHAIVFVKCVQLCLSSVCNCICQWDKCVQLYLSIIQVVGWRNSIQMWRREHMWFFNLVTTGLLVLTSRWSCRECEVYWYIWYIQSPSKRRER